VLAFAGIGDPEKLFVTLADAGVAVAKTMSFADHHRYTPDEALALCAQADAEGLVMVTTEKDAARLQGNAGLADLRRRVCALPVTLVLDEEAEFCELLARQRLNRSG
jgi:tetraacyldisaccharide 4'-kinase